MEHLCTPNGFQGTDTERIEQALTALRRRGGGTLTIPPREDPDGRREWVIDRAILLDAHMTIILQNATIRLSDGCRDNFIRSSNCGIGITDVRPLTDIHVIGIGAARLEGAARPRSTGDSAKQLGVRSFGTDAGKPDENPYGDWRNIGILMAHVSRFSVTGVTIVDSHAWAMSFEWCSQGRLANLSFDSTGFRMIDGQKEPNLNQDGIDLRMGCHDIVIDTVTGRTGDDVVALTAIPGNREAGSMGFAVAGTRRTGADDIWNIRIRNILASSRCQIIRLLNTGGVKIHDVQVDGVTDTNVFERPAIVTVRIGDANPAWGGVTPLGDTCGILVSNVMSHARDCILIAGSLSESVLSHVLNFNAGCPVVRYESGEANVRNVRCVACENFGN